MHRHLRRPGTGVHDRARPARIAVPTSAAIGHGKGSLEGSLSVSGPVSRILSRAAIYLCGLPGPRRAGSTVLLGLAPGGVCLAAASPRRRCALTAPFHRCLFATHVWPRHRLCISVALSRGFPRVGVTHRHALWCPDFPRGVFSPPAVARPALSMVAPADRLAGHWARLHRISCATMPVAVITGAGSGLGRAIALELAERGFLVHVTD